MANVLRGIVVLFAIRAVFDAASAEEKLSSVEDEHLYNEFPVTVNKLYSSIRPKFQ